MDTQTGRRNFVMLTLCAALASAAVPASAQLTPLTQAPATQANAGQPRQGGIVTFHSYVNPGNNPGYSRNPSASQPNFVPSPYPGSTNFGYSPGVPLSPGFGGNVAPQPGFGFQPGVTLGPGFGAQSLQNLSSSGQFTGSQLRYGNDGVPVLPTLPGYATNGYYGSANQTSANCPPLLGGYYFSNYTNGYAGGYTLPTAYALYGSFPTYFYVGDNVGVTILPTAPAYSYDSGYLPYEAPSTQVNNQYNYTVNNYYASPSGDGGQPSAPRVGATAPASTNGYDTAFADIQKAWLAGDIGLLKTHLRDSDVKIAVSIKGKYSYSIASSDFASITKDAFDKLTTYSFEFTSLRKQTNGDVTGYASHVYTPSNGTDGSRQTIYLAFTLSKYKNQWDLTAIDSSTTPIDGQHGSAAKNDQSVAPQDNDRRVSASG